MLEGCCGRATAAPVSLRHRGVLHRPQVGILQRDRLHRLAQRGHLLKAGGRDHSAAPPAGWTLRSRGATMRWKPSLAASEIRRLGSGTARSSPVSPTSPTIITSPGMARSVAADTTAAAIARSAAGSRTVSPPATETNTSALLRSSCAR